MSETTKGCLPVNAGAHRAGVTRERLIRRIQVGDVDGALIGGRWFVDERSLAEFMARQESRSRLPAPGSSR